MKYQKYLQLFFVFAAFAMMGGKISAESEYSKGSVFSIYFYQDLVSSESIGEETAEKLKQFKYVRAKIEKDIEPSWMPYEKVFMDYMMPGMDVKRLESFAHGSRSQQFQLSH